MSPLTPHTSLQLSRLSSRLDNKAICPTDKKHLIQVFDRMLSTQTTVSPEEKEIVHQILIKLSDSPIEKDDELISRCIKVSKFLGYQIPYRLTPNQSEPSSIFSSTRLIPPSLPEISHGNLIDLLTAAGHMGNQEGVCTGVVMTAFQYSFLDKLPSFYKHLENVYLILEKLENENIPLEDLTKENLKLICDAVAPNSYVRLQTFLTKIELYFHSEHDDYEILLKNHESFDQSIKIIETIVAECTSESLNKALKIFGNYASETNLQSPFGVLISSVNHIIGALYDAKTASWHYIDSNQLDKDQFPLLKAFTEEKSTFLSLKICIPKDCENIQLLEKIKTFKEQVIKHQAEKFPSSTDIRKKFELIYMNCVGNDFKTIDRLLKNIDQETLKLILKKSHASNKTSLLTISCLHGNKEVVTLLLDKGANINLNDEDGNTPLTTTSARGRATIINLLLDRRADINLNDEDGNTPLTTACYRGHKEIVELLLDRGADINLNDRSGDTPLTTARYLGHKEIVELLLNRGATHNFDPEEEVSLLTTACFKGDIELVRLLLNRCSNIDLNDESGNTPLTAACFYGKKEIVKLLLDKGANINLNDRRGDTPLTIACARGKTSIVKLLLDHKANFTGRNAKGKNPLWLASEGGFLEIVKQLEQLGATKLSKNELNFYIDIATENEHPNIANFLSGCALSKKKRSSSEADPNLN